jgi:phage gp46-like protein
MVLECLKWLIDDGLAKEISCAAERTGKNTIAYTVTIERPDGETVEVKEAWSVV